VRRSGAEDDITGASVVTFTCYECSVPMVIMRDTLRLLAATTPTPPITCPRCKSTYRITVEQLSAPDVEMAGKLRRERVAHKSLNGKTAGVAVVNDMGLGGGVL